MLRTLRTLRTLRIRVKGRGRILQRVALKRGGILRQVDCKFGLKFGLKVDGFLCRGAGNQDFESLKTVLLNPLERLGI